MGFFIYLMMDQVHFSMQLLPCLIHYGTNLVLESDLQFTFYDPHSQYGDHEKSKSWEERTMTSMTSHDHHIGNDDHEK